VRSLGSGGGGGGGSRLFFLALLFARWCTCFSCSIEGFGGGHAGREEDKGDEEEDSSHRSNGAK